MVSVSYIQWLYTLTLTIDSCHLYLLAQAPLFEFYAMNVALLFFYFFLFLYILYIFRAPVRAGLSLPWFSCWHFYSITRFHCSHFPVGTLCLCTCLYTCYFLCVKNKLDWICGSTRTVLAVFLRQCHMSDINSAGLVTSKSNALQLLVTFTKK